MGAALVVGFAAMAAQATTIDYTGASLKGATGSLSIVSTGTEGQFRVTWSLDSSTFQGDDTHNVLQSLGFKAFTEIKDVSVVDGGPAGDLYFGGISNKSPNCDQNGSSNGFVCFDLVPDVKLPAGTISKSFLVTGTLDASLAWTFKGKYGPGNGWVISEQAPPVPEPTSAAVFGLGALIVGAALRRRMRS